MAFTEKRLAGPTALTANTETNLYVCPTAQTTTTLIKQVLVTNTGSATTFDLSLVPQGGTAGTTNRLFSALALSANETVLLDVSQVMSSGDFISTKSGAGSTVNVTISGVENSGLMVISGLADSAVTTAKIADLNVATSKIDNLAVTTGKIANNAVTQGKLSSSLSGITVTTSSLRSTAVPSPFEGQVIFETDTNRVLVWDNAAWVMIADTDQPAGMQLIKTTSFSAATTVDFENVFTSEFESYKLLFHYWQASTGDDGFIRMRSSSGIVSSNDYLTTRTEAAGGGTVNAFYAGSGYSSGFRPTYIEAGSSTDRVSGYVDIFRPFLSEWTTMTSNFQRNGGDLYRIDSAGIFRLTTSFTGFSLVRGGSGTQTGKVSVYGLRN